MFIAYTKNNDKFVENNPYKKRVFTWDDIPDSVSITALALTHPVPVMIDNKRISPKISIKRFHYYYFFNEATISVIQSRTGGLEYDEANLQAKVIAGIDVEKEFVLEVRVDRLGNTSINVFPLDVLKSKINNGLMRKTIFRAGINCPRDKKML